jgi:hypothetical protein
MEDNPQCPVPGCKTKHPHANDPIVKSLIDEFASPAKLTQWVFYGMAELRDSICRDIMDRKVFAWHTRLRQPEELYIRTLYALFIADEKELHHILSGATPNSLSGLYTKVNALVFEGRGALQVSQPGLKYGTFPSMDTLNDDVHVSFPAFMACIGMVRNPQYFPSDFPAKYHTHLTRYCDYFEYMHGMFKAGKEKRDVLRGVINLHRPTSYWDQQQRGLRETK